MLSIVFVAVVALLLGPGQSVPVDPLSREVRNLVLDYAAPNVLQPRLQAMRAAYKDQHPPDLAKITATQYLPTKHGSLAGLRLREERLDLVSLRL